MKKSLQINDIEYQVGPCRDCGAVANELDALRCLAQFQKGSQGRNSCSVCGKTIPLVFLYLAHDHRSDWPKPEWIAYGSAHEECIRLSTFKCPVLYLHFECAERALPFAPIAELKEKSRDSALP